MSRLITKSSLGLFFIAVGSFGLLWGGSYKHISGIFESITASGFTLLAVKFYERSEGRYNPYNIWKLEEIFNTRAEVNPIINQKMENQHVEKLDIIALGLSSWRSSNRKVILNSMNNGMNVRILTMDPNGNFVAAMNKNEGNTKGALKKTILDLEDWVRRLNNDSSNGKIELKYYTCMTLDFYWRIDDDMYIGPYMNGKQSQQTITYKFTRGGKGFQFYRDYFEEQWGNSNNITANV